MRGDVRRLGGIGVNGGITYRDLEEWRHKAKLLDEAVEWMTGRIDSEKLMKVYDILTRPAPQKK